MRVACRAAARVRVLASPAVAMRPAAAVALPRARCAVAAAAAPRRSLASSSSSSSSSSTKVLSQETLNPAVLAAEYAVRGELVLKAGELQQQLQQGKKLPFNEIIMCNIGNPHDLKQQPITFFRQVLALCHYPALMHDEATRKHFPADAIARATAYLKSTKNCGTGAYTHSKGIALVRDEVAAFIKNRDGYPSDPEEIFLTDGASSGIKNVLNMIIRSESDGVLVPIPQYPLYSASIALLGGSLTPYHLDESNGWALQRSQLEASVKKARAAGKTVRALVVINPGNPTGQCLTAENIAEVLKFCHNEKIVVLADEVYQTNIYRGTPFTSFKKVLRTLGDEYKGFELFSFNSTSKGFIGECGQRGGYTEATGVDGKVMDQLYKLASISLCSNTSGQIMTGLMVNPPTKGTPSYDLYARERDTILNGLKSRAEKLVKTLNGIPGITCNPVEGAMYAFPRIDLPAGAVAAAKKAGKPADTFYCLELLHATGIVVVPGTGFGQAEGTYHFRTTILPPDAQMDEMLTRLGKFHRDFIAKYQ